MANEFIARNGIIANADSRISGTLNVSGDINMGGVKIATESYVTTAIANLTDSAPDLLNTLNELAAALGDDPNFATTVTNNIATKVPLAGNASITGWISVSSHTQGTPIIKAVQEDTDTGYYLFQGMTGSSEVFRVDRNGNLVLGGAITAVGYNKGNWDTAFGWGNNYISDVRVEGTNLVFTGQGSAYNESVDLSALPFQAQGNYLTAESDTLASVVARGSVTNGDIRVSGTLSVYNSSNYGLIKGYADNYHGMVFRGYPTTYNTLDVTAADVISFYEYGGEFAFYQKNSSGTLKQVANLSPTAAVFRTYASDNNYNIRITGGDQFNAYYGEDATAMYVNWNGGQTRFGGSIRSAGVIYADTDITATNGNGKIYLGGNLHIDSYNETDIYLNFYSNRYIRTYGDTYLNNYVRINKNWGEGDYGAEAFTIRGIYPSIALRSTNANFKWLLHTDSSGNFRYYSGSEVDDNAWTNRFTFGTDNNLYVDYGHIYASTGNSTQWNAAYNDKINSASFNTADGVLTLTQQDGGTVTVDLDGRYLTSETDSQELEWNQAEKLLTISNGNTVDLSQMASVSDIEDAGFITGESDTLNTVVSRGSTTTSAITLGPSSTNGGPMIYQTYSSDDKIGSIGSEYSSGAMLIGYGAAGKNGGSGYVSTFDNFSGHRGLIKLSSGEFSVLNTGSAVQTTTGDALTMTTRFVVNNDGNVGIGTTTPNRKLTVSGNGTLLGLQSDTVAGYSEIELTANGVGAAYVFKSSAGKTDYGGAGAMNYYNVGSHAFHSNSVNNILHLTAAGNVGIGTTSPSYKLDVSGQIKVDNGVGNGSGQALVVGGSGDVTLTSGGSLFFGAYDYGNSTYIRGYDNSAGLYFYADGTLTMNVAGNGNVGIGITAPSSKLHIVTGTPTGAAAPSADVPLLIDSSGNQFIEFRTTSASSGLMQGTLYSDNGKNAFIGYKEYTGAVANTYGESIHIAVIDYSASDAGSGIYLGATSNPRLGVTTPYMFIKGNGKVGIGTTSPSEKLHVNGAAIFDGGAGDSSTDSVLYVTKSNSNDWGLYVNASGVDYGMYVRISPSAGYAFGIHNGATWTTRITGNGIIHLNNKDTIDSTDSWLRLNQSGEYGSGVYTPGVLRNDGNFVNYGGIYGYATIRGRKAQTDGTYTTAALWTESYDNTTTGIAFHISGVVGKFLEMRTNGSLYWDGAPLPTQAWVTSQGYTSTTYVDEQIAALVDSAPDALNTLKELSNALGDDQNFATNVTNSIAAKVSKSGDTMTGNLTTTGLIVGNGVATGRQPYGPLANANIVLTSSASDSSGVCGIEFYSGNNYPSDGASIYFENNTTGGGSERAKLTIRVENDQEDHVEIRAGKVVLNANTYSGGGQDPAIIFQHNDSAIASISSNGQVNASGGNSSQWNTAYGWGNHANYGYWNTDLTEPKDIQSTTVRFVGDVEVQGTFTESSSIRFKENIKPLEPTLDKVEQLNPVTYNKIGVQEEEIGLIAEEVAQLFPEVVTYNEEGQASGIQYQRLSVILLKAVQELTDRVNKLENK